MRLLIVGLNFAPELTGIGKFTGEMAAWLAARGHEVSVVTTRPYYPEWKRAPGFSGWTWRGEDWSGCRVMRCPLYVPRRQSGLQRILHLASFGLSSLPAALARALKGKPDVVMVMAPTLFSAPTALAAAWLASAKSWLHVLDLEVDAAFEMGFIRNRLLIDSGRRVERGLMGRFDRVSTISSKMRERIERKGVPPKRLIDFPNWVDTNAFRPLAVPVPLRRELEIPDQACVALYSGSLGKKQGLEHVVAAARLLASEEATSPLFLIAGAGPMRAELERSAQGLSNMRFLPLQPFDRFNEFLNVADIHLLPQRRDASDLVMPSKLLVMLATGRPVVATALPDSEIARTLVDAGVTVQPEDPPRLAAAIRLLAADPERRHSMSEAAVRLARCTMEAETILRRFESQLLELLEGSAKIGRNPNEG